MKQLPKTIIRRTAVGAALVTALALTACGSDDDTPQDSASPEPTTSVEVSDQPAPEPADPEPTTDPSPEDEDTTQPLGEFGTGTSEAANWPDFGDAEAVYPTEVRAAAHDGFERVVVEHHGTGTPSYHAEYTADPLAPGIGTPIDTGDATYLEVVLSGTTPSALVEADDLPVMLDSGAQFSGFATEAVGTVVSYAPWEATSNYVIGLDEPRPYSVTILQDPVRLVIDIQLDD